MSEVGRNLFMYHYGPERKKQAHLDAALAALPSEEGEHEAITTIAKQDHPRYGLYSGLYIGMLNREHGVGLLKAGLDHSNHIVRSLAVRAIQPHYSEHRLKWHEVASMSQKAATDPHHEVVTNVVLHSPGGVDSDTLTKIAAYHPSRIVADKARDIILQRAMFDVR